MQVIPKSPFITLMVAGCAFTLASCSPAPQVSSTQPAQTAPPQADSPDAESIHHDDVSGKDLHLPPGWTPHQIMGATVIFAPAPIDGYKPRVFVQRQDPGIKGGVTEHLAAAEQQVNQKKYDGFELITKGMKIESGIDYGELVYRYQPKNLPVTLTNSMCVLSLAPDRWITFQTSSATTAQEKIAEDFALIRQGIFATGGSK